MMESLSALEASSSPRKPGELLERSEDGLRTPRISVALFLIAMLLAPTSRGQASRAQSETALRQLEQELVEAAARNDWQFWDRVVAPEWTSIDLSGRQWDKPAILTMMKNFKGTIQSAKLYDVQVRFFRDDVAMVTGIATTSGSLSGKVVRIKFRSTDILAYREGKWLVVASQSTPIKETP